MRKQTMGWLGSEKRRFGCVQTKHEKQPARRAREMESSRVEAGSRGKMSALFVSLMGLGRWVGRMSKVDGECGSLAGN